MVKNVRCCDHCGKTLDPMKSTIDIIFDINHWKYVNLCTNCFEELWDLINKFCGGAAQ